MERKQHHHQGMSLYGRNLVFQKLYMCLSIVLGIFLFVHVTLKMGKRQCK